MAEIRVTVGQRLLCAFCGEIVTPHIVDNQVHRCGMFAVELEYRDYRPVQQGGWRISVPVHVTTIGGTDQPEQVLGRLRQWVKNYRD